MKHIKLKAKYNPKNPENMRVEVRVIEQTHRGHEFGAINSGFLHNNVHLYSCGCPEFRVRSFSLSFYLRGDYSESDEVSVFMSVAHWEAVKAAVKAYNEKFA